VETTFIADLPLEERLGANRLFCRDFSLTKKIMQRFWHRRLPANKDFKRPFPRTINLSLSWRGVNRHPQHDLLPKNSPFAGFFEPLMRLGQLILAVADSEKPRWGRSSLCVWALARILSL
jgi:hypothetical protein